MTFFTCSVHRPLRESYEARFSFGISIKMCKINLTIAGKLCILSTLLFVYFFIQHFSEGNQVCTNEGPFHSQNWISFHQRDDKIESLLKLGR